MQRGHTAVQDNLILDRGGQYGEVIAQVMTEVYRVDNAEMTQAGSVRAEMMRYRDDRRDGHMQSEDWSHIEQGLTRSYQLLKTAVNQGT